MTFAKHFDSARTLRPQGLGDRLSMPARHGRHAGSVRNTLAIQYD